MNLSYLHTDVKTICSRASWSDCMHGPLKYWVSLCENCEAQWELRFFLHFSFHGASLRYFHLFWERRSIIRNATETTQAHTRTLIPLHLSHQIVQGRKNFCDKARPNPRGNHIVQLDGGNLIIAGSNCDLGVCTDADATQGLFVYVNINLKQWRWKISISVLVSSVQSFCQWMRTSVAYHTNCGICKSARHLFHYMCHVVR